MKTNKNLFIAIVAVLIPAAVWVVVETRATFQPAVKNNKSGKQDSEELYITQEDIESLARIAKKSRPVCTFDNQIDILKGIGAIRVMVEDLTPEIKQLGLTKQVLQTDVELLLRKYDIEIEKNSSLCILYIRVSALKIPIIESFAVSVSVELTDCVIPIRPQSIMMKNPIVIVDAKVWQNGNVMHVGKQRVRGIREAVEDCVKEFINDYLAANPREGSENNKPKTD